MNDYILRDTRWQAEPHDTLHTALLYTVCIIAFVQLAQLRQAVVSKWRVMRSFWVAIYRNLCRIPVSSTHTTGVVALELADQSSGAS